MLSNTYLAFLCATAAALLASATPTDYFTKDVFGCTSGEGGSFSWTYGGPGTPDTSTVSRVFCGKGWSVGTNRTVNYEGTYFPNGDGKFGVFGWTRNPLTQYIVMDSFGYYYQSPDAVVLGQTICNGNAYNILRVPQVNQPSIDGKKSFQQFWSARTGILRGPISGSIDMNCHFKAWEAAGLKLGTTHDYQIGAADLIWYNSGTAKLTISD